MKSHEKRQCKTPTIFLIEHLMALIPNTTVADLAENNWNSILSKSVFNFLFFCLKLLNLFRGDSPHAGRRDQRRGEAGLARQDSNWYSTCGSSQAVHKHHPHHTLTPALWATCQLLSGFFSSKANCHGRTSEKCRTKLAKCSTLGRCETRMRSNTAQYLV